MHPTTIRHWSRAVLLALGWIALSACSEGSGERVASDAETEAVETPRSGPPSIALVVIESLRVDAIAGYGADRTSPLVVPDPTATPHLDALIAKGRRFDRAISASSATVTSHASLFSGLAAHEHGVGLWTQVGAPADLETIAEQLAARGYATAGFSENPMAGPEYGLDQGFDRFVTPEPEGLSARLDRGLDASEEFRLVDRVARWLEARDRTRPYFLFVNIADPHLPFPRTLAPRFRPEGVPTEAIDAALAKVHQEHRVGRQLPDGDSLEVLRGAYVQSVADADRKLGALATRLAANDDAILVVTADHGTHLGERRLLGHDFSVDNRALHVPLVVHGAPGVTPASSHADAVSQWRVADSIRCWAGIEPACSRALPGAAGPADAEEAGPIVSVAGNEKTFVPPAGVFDTSFLNGKTRYSIAYADAKEGFEGRIVSFLDPPLKYVWRRYGPASLYDTSWDPAERTDQIDRADAKGRALAEYAAQFVKTERLDQAQREAPDPSNLRARVLEAYEAGVAAMVADENVATDVVWFARLLLEDRPNEALQAWYDRQRPRHADELYYPIVDPSVLSTTESPEVLPRGILRFAMYLHAAVAGPDAIALPHLEEYLSIEDADGYILTHQLSGLEWARALDRALPAEVYARAADYVERIRAEHRTDHRFRDLWAERAAFVALFGQATPSELESWSRTIVDHHLGNGDWGHGSFDLEFDGDRSVGEQPRSHVRGLSLIVLSRYLLATDQSA